MRLVIGADDATGVRVHTVIRQKNVSGESLSRSQ